MNFNPIFTKIYANLKTTAVLSVPEIPGWSFALKIKNYRHIGERKPGLDFWVVQSTPAEANGKLTAIVYLDIESQKYWYPSCSNIGIKISFLYSEAMHKKMETENLHIQVSNLLEKS